MIEKSADLNDGIMWRSKIALPQSRGIISKQRGIQANPAIMRGTQGENEQSRCTEAYVLLYSFY